MPRAISRARSTSGPSDPSFHLTSTGTADAFIWVLSGSGDLLSAFNVGGPTDSITLGSATDTIAYSISIDAEGNIILPGASWVRPTSTPAPASATSPAAGGCDIFVAKYSPLLSSQVPVTVHVDDGRGGSDEQSFTIDLSNAASGEIRGRLYDEAGASSIRLLSDDFNRPDNLVVDNGFTQFGTT